MIGKGTFQPAEIILFQVHCLCRMFFFEVNFPARIFFLGEGIFYWNILGTYLEQYFLSFVQSFCLIKIKPETPQTPSFLNVSVSLMCRYFPLVTDGTALRAIFV